MWPYVIWTALGLGSAKAAKAAALAAAKAAKEGKKK
jgi:hypothetical protein